MKKIISLLVVLTMAFSCFGLTALATELPECEASILSGDDLVINDELTLDFGMNFKAVDTEETVEDSPYKDYFCDFEITFSEDVNVILAGKYANYQNGEWIVLKTDAGENYGDLTEFGYRFTAGESVKVLSTAIEALLNEGHIKNPEEAIFTYEEVVTLVNEFTCGIKIVDKKAVDVTLELCLYNPEDADDKKVVTYNKFEQDAKFKFPEGEGRKLLKEELNVKGADMTLVNEFSAVLDFGMNFKALDTPDDLIDSPYSDYTVDFELTFLNDATAILAGQYYGWGENGVDENWIAVKADEGEFEGVTPNGCSFKANEPVRIVEKAFKLHPALKGIRMKYEEIVTGVREFNCGLKITGTEEPIVGIELALYLYETDGKGIETGYKYLVGDVMKFEYKAASIPEDATEEEIVEIVNNATSINDSNKEAVAEAIKTLPVEKQEEVKLEVFEAVADEEVVVTDEEDLGVEVVTIPETNDGIEIEVKSEETEDESLVSFDINAYEASTGEEIKDEILEAPIVVKIPLAAFGVGENETLSALYHEHNEEITKIDFIIKDGYVIFTMNKFSSIIGKIISLQEGEATLELVELTDVEEGTAAFDVVLHGDSFKTIQYFGAGQFVINVDGDATAEFVLSDDAKNNNTKLYPQANNQYLIEIEDTLENLWTKDETYSVNNSFTLGTITLTGWGKSGTLKLTDILMNKHTDSPVNGGTDTKVITTNTTASASFDILVPSRTLDIEVYLAHKVKNQKAPYQAMTVTITEGGELVKDFKLGNEEDITFDEATNTYKVSADLKLNTPYVVTVSGAGYRKASYPVSMTTDKMLKFWNNIVEEKAAMEIYLDESNIVKAGVVSTNFLAGDIVNDGIIDIYDLSAVVSYFGQRPNDLESESKYAQYDLNRDGIINSKDVIIVTNGWGN